MDTSVAPVVRGDFLYRDVLLVDVGGELKRHARASEAEIRNALNAPAGQKDQVGHWYEAQLVHYGLQRTKEKNTAKLRLLQALNQKKLKAQPADLADLEKTMKKEYAAAVRKAKGGGDAGKGKKRAREEEEEQPKGKKTKVSVRVGDVQIDIDQSEVQSTSRKQSGGNSSAPKTTKKAPAKTPSAPTSASKKKSNEAWNGDPRDHPDNVFQRPASFEGVKTPKPKEAKKESTQPSTTKKSTVKKEPKVKNEPASNFHHQEEESNEMDTRPDVTGKQIYLTGVYNLSCPSLAEQVPDHADKFRLFICVDNEGGRIWGGFELAWKSGVIKIDDIAWSMQLNFGWRAKDYQASGKGLKFGKGCFGDIEFDGEERIRGVFYNLYPEPLRFEGVRRPGPLWCGKSAYKFQQEWDGYPKEAYGR